MTITARIGIIGGNGWLGGAIASAFADRAARGVVAGASRLLAEPGADAGQIVQRDDRRPRHDGRSASSNVRQRLRAAVAAGLAAAATKAVAMAKA